MKTFSTLTSMASGCFAQHRERTLFFETTDNRAITYAEGLEFIHLISEKLSQSGISKGDMILTYTPLSVESVLLCWACLNTGIVFVPVDHNWPKELLQSIIVETNPKLLLIDSERAENLGGISEHCIIVLNNDRSKSGAGISFFEWIQNQNWQPKPFKNDVLPEDLAVLLYTSGSTGIPKGVMLSQQALMNSGSLIGEHFEWNSSDVFLNLGDLHSMSGLRNTCLAPLFVGASFVIASSGERNNVLLMLELISRVGVSYVGVAPTVIRQLNIIFTEARKNQLGSLKAILCTGGSLAKDQLEIFYHNYTKPVLNYYGLTETAGICSGHSFNTFNPSDNSIGPAVGAELIIDSDLETDSTGNTGELLVRSQNLMTGYFKRDNETAQVLKNGCFYTGDIVRKRADGCFEILGRKRNIVKNIQSELIYLEEIDIALESLSLVHEACTCSFSPYEEDEKTVAFIVVNSNCELPHQEITNTIKEQLVEKLGKNRMPWCYYFEDSLPRTTAGKIQRQNVKEKLHEYIAAKHKRYF